MLKPLAGNLVVACLLVAVTAIPAYAQLREEVRVDLVEVYLSAVDHDRRPIQDLQSGDFVVKENNKARDITHFTRLLAKDSDVPLTIIYLMDTSGSMSLGSLNERRVDVARKFAEMTLAEMKPQDRLQVVAFDYRYLPLTPMTSDFQVISKALDQVKIEGNPGTMVLGAVKKAAEELKDQWGRKMIVLCSDGETDKRDLPRLEEVIRLLIRYDIAILALGTTDIASWHSVMGSLHEGSDHRPGAQMQQKIIVAGQSGHSPPPNTSNFSSSFDNNSQAKRLLTKLAEESGGDIYFPNSEKKLNEALERLRTIIRSQYMLGFPPQNAAAPAAKGQWVKIKVECRRKGIKLQYRKGYYSGD